MTRTTVRLALLLCSGALAMLVLGFAAGLNGSDATGARLQDERSEPDEVSDHMEEIKSALRKLARAVALPERKDESLSFIAEIEKHVVAAKILTPPRAAEIPPPDRKAFVLKFRTALCKLLGELSEIEIDIIENRFDKARTRVFENVTEMRDAAHEKFQSDDDHE